MQLFPPVLIQHQKSGAFSDLPLRWNHADSFQLQQGHFLIAIRTGRRPINCADKALMLMQRLDAIYNSSDTGHEIRLEGAKLKEFRTN